MALLEIRDPNTGNIKSWVWVAGAGLGIGGIFLLFAGSAEGGGGGGSVAPSTGTGLGGAGGGGSSTDGGLDELGQALEALNGRIDDLEPNPATGVESLAAEVIALRNTYPTLASSWYSVIGSKTDRSTETVAARTDRLTRESVYLQAFGGDSLSDLASQVIALRTAYPTAASTWYTNVGSKVNRTTETTAQRTSRLTKEAAYLTNTKTGAVGTGSINPYPVSTQVNPASPEAVFRGPIRADI